MNIDEKLALILEDIPDRDLIAEQIKQAFVEAGWGSIEAQDKLSVAFKNKGYMTGQDWYERFEKELKSPKEHPKTKALRKYTELLGRDHPETMELMGEIIMDNILEAAKRASGLDT